MGMWPFRRRSQRKKAAAGGAGNSSPERMHDAGIQQDPARQDGAELAHSGPERRKSRRDTKRKASRESKKLQRDPEKRDKRRTYSFSPGRKDSIRVARAPDDRPPVPAIPPSKLNEKGRALTEKRASNPAGAKPLRASTQPPEEIQEWQRMPTLHKRSAQEMGRRKSSKKRKGDPDREAEIKAMVAYMPNRPAADVNSSGRPMKRETIRRGKVVHKLEKKSSDVSLPLADSLRSSLSDNSEPQTSFVVSGFDMLAPRPTIRYSENPRYVPGSSGFGPARSDSKMKLSDRPPIAADTLKANKWIDDLADDLSAGELRELMERDEKRKEKKKIADRIKMERRLARRQEKQKADEAEATRQGTPPPINMERGVLGRDVVGLGIGTSAVVTSNKRKSSVGSEDERGPRPAESFRQDSAISGHNPFADFHRSPSLATENFTPGSERSDPVIETALMGTVAKASVSPTLPAKGHTRGQSSISQMMDLSHSEAPQPSTIPEPVMQPAATPVKTPSSWTSFFKLRGAKSKRATPPSSFSNTSRDSMHAGQAPQIGYTPMRSTSNIPKRTMSKFREDLPELPLSPPDSRVQSPEADVVQPIQTASSDIRTGVQVSLDDPRVRYDTPTSGYRSLEALRQRQETPNSHRSLDAPSPEATVLSQSLASIDSEGSWLSGRRAGSKRGSSALAQHPPIRDSSDSLSKKYKEFSESAEELGIAEDEYFNRLTPGPEEEHKIHNRRSGNPVPSSDDEEGGSISSPVSSEKTKWGAVGRQPTVIHREPRAKSREGLLTEFDDGSDSELPSSPVSTDPKDDGLQRATSIDLNRKHARHISAGSARLLDLKPSNSVDSRRNSARLSS